MSKSYLEYRRDLKNGKKASPETQDKANLADLPKKDESPAKGKEAGKGLKKPFPKRIKAATKKRQKQNRAYTPLKKKFLKENQVCDAQLPGCTWVSTDLHHAAGRSGKQLLKVEDFRALCSNCHRIITDQDKEARQKGLVKTRLGKPNK